MFEQYWLETGADKCFVTFHSVRSYPFEKNSVKCIISSVKLVH